VRTTKYALEWLVSQGFLLKESKPYSGEMYRLNARMQKKADSFAARDLGERGDVAGS